jgi:hypothetical protein
MAGGAMLAGIGFTMALFIANLAFDQELLDSAKLGIFLASVTSAALSRLTAAIDKTRTETSAGDDDEDETRVSLSNRALPLVDLLTAAVQQNCDVMWE